MKTTVFAGAAIAASLFAGAASAATLDFIAEANGNERGVMDGTVINMDGVDVTFSSSHYAYFDSGDAGLGVCQRVTNFTNGGEENRCASGPNDDNVTAGESVTISFASMYTLGGLTFTAEGHYPLFSDTLTLLFGYNGMDLQSYTFNELRSAMFTDVESATFAYGGQNPDQFYLSGATLSAVPVPASLPLLALGLGGLVALRRRKAA